MDPSAELPARDPEPPSGEPEEQRAALRDTWEAAAAGWGRRADRVRDWGMPVSAVMIEALGLQPGQRVLELAAGPGDTGFMAAELVKPGGTLISSDLSEAMLAVARERARLAGVDNVEFRQLELEWIDLEAASVDAVLCRWGIMLVLDPGAAAREIRRVLRRGGRAALAVWDAPGHNPWATIPSRALIELGHAEPPEPGSPGMFALASPGRLGELLEGAGFEDVAIEPVSVARRYERVEQYVEETLDMSPMFQRAVAGLEEAARSEVTERVTREARRFEQADGSIALPGSALVAAAGA